MAMETNWASDHLQTIRTLMERSALYGRALATVRLAVGLLGIAGAVLANFLPLLSPRAFSLYWLGFGAVTLTASFLLVRRQALRAGEPLWSPPTRRITSALSPCFFVGLGAGAHSWVSDASPAAWLLATVWITAYGCALHAAGFFMQRGIKLFGWLFILAGGVLLLFGPAATPLHSVTAAHFLMGLFFGGFHLGYGVYLYFTEKARSQP